MLVRGLFRVKKRVYNKKFGLYFRRASVTIAPGLSVHARIVREPNVDCNNSVRKGAYAG